MLRLEYATVSLVRSCAANTAGIPKSNNNNSRKLRGLLLVRYFKNGIVYLRHLQRETNAVKNFLSTARQSTADCPTKLSQHRFVKCINISHAPDINCDTAFLSGLQVRIASDCCGDLGVEIRSMMYVKLKTRKFEG